MGLEGRIADGLKSLSLEYDSGVPQKAVRYLALLRKWNRVANLTAITDPDEMVTRHLLDSCTLHVFLRGKRILDVGSGAGLPGIPLALLNPHKDFILLDSNGKKTRFMTQAAIDLGLGNVTVVQSRLEDFSGEFDHVVCRAFRSLHDLVAGSYHLLTAGGSLLAMKGPGVISELSELDARGFHYTAHGLQTPGSKRLIVEIQRQE